MKDFQYILVIKVIFSLFASLKGNPFEDHNFCVPPAEPPNGKVSLGRGDVVVRYSCDPGFKLIGTPVAVCIAGKWSSAAPECRARSKSKLNKSKEKLVSTTSDLQQKDQQIVSVFEEFDEPKINTNKVDEDKKIKNKERRKGRRRNKKDKRKKNKDKNLITEKEEIGEKNTGNKAIEIPSTPEPEKKKTRKEERKRRNKKRGKHNRKKRKRQKQSRTKNATEIERAKEGEEVIDNNILFHNLSNSIVDKDTKTENKDKIKKPREEKKRRKGRKRKRKKGKNDKEINGEIKDNSILVPLSLENRTGEKLSTGNSKTILTPTPSTESLIISSTSSAKTPPNQEHSLDNSIQSRYENDIQEKIFISEAKNRLSSSATGNDQSTSLNNSSDSNGVEAPERPTTVSTRGDKGRDLLHDIISRMKNKKKIATNIIDSILDNNNNKNETNLVDGNLESKQISKEKKKAKNNIHEYVSKHTDSNLLDNDLNLDPDYDNNISGYDEYEDIDDKPKNKKQEQTNYYDPDYETEDNNGAGSRGDPSKGGYPSPEKRLYDEDEVKSAKERFVEEEDIDFATLDTTCVISELDSLYLPPPRVEHSHVTSYTTVTNPARPNNVYVEAIYECDFGHQLKEATSNRLFCKKNKWVGKLAECIAYETEEGMCGANNGGCEQICHRSEDATTCSCYRGFTLHEDEKSCRDVDECLKNNGGCEGVCFNTLGSHQCYCPKGYRLATNGKTCVDKNECILRNGHGPCQDTCYNTEGSYYCTCEAMLGAKLGADKHTCEDVDECALNNGGCSHICLNTFGQTFCTCPLGFVLGMDWKTCKDINECDYAEIIKECGDKMCVNTPGSYKCSETQEASVSLECSKGFQLSLDGSFCEDINECDDERFGCSHTCVNTEGAAHCDCPSGFVLSGNGKLCDDIDECKDSTCSHTCINNDGSFTCTCPGGMKLAPDSESCIDINECASNNGNCSHLCTNTNGSFECGCKFGHTLEENGLHCVDINECEKNNGDCDQVCTNLEGDFLCTCIDGYELEDDLQCIDIDECALQKSRCEHQCVNTEGSYECHCHEGFELDSDGFSCIDVDECGIEHNCSHFCSNKDGSYVCQCPDGWKLSNDKHTCKDINECKKNNAKCSHVCLNVKGGYECSCPPGMKLLSEGTSFEKKHVCIDIDECEINNGNCSHICENNEGSYECLCPEGFDTYMSTNGTVDVLTCKDVDECLDNNGDCSHICVNLEGKYECQCPKGHKIQRDGITCVDNNECLKENGGCSHNCENLPGGYECTCPDGWDIDYNYDYDNEATYIEGGSEPWKTCIDIDECEKSGNQCSHKCVNEKGGFYCKCLPGYVLINDFECQDIDECLVDQGGCSHSCTNLEGSFQCHCPPGFQLTDFTRCLDVDECLLSNGNCSHFCKNEIGSYKCSCSEGYLLESDNITCADFNECGELNGGCSHECKNTNGKYICSCPLGMILGEDEHDCVDLNECETDNGECSHVCINSKESYKCECPSGLSLAVDKKTCLDVDECGLNNGGCSHQCFNKEGHYTCICPSGYELMDDEHICSDINECEENNGGCFEKCLNIEGSYKCSCEEGYELGQDNKTCHDINECNAFNGGCTDKCHNTRGSFRCECPLGFHLISDGATCEDLNECHIANGGCSHICVNTFGSFSCQCPDGYTLDDDKYTCRDINECENDPCEHDCFNTKGSYFCKCQSGYVPRPDSTDRCWDINECLEDNGSCAQDCFNTIGSYLCSCREGFKLDVDRLSCQPKPVFCPILSAPNEGQMTCNNEPIGDTYPSGTVCSFSCSSGWDLHGDKNSTCTNYGTWTSSSISCQSTRCPSLSEVEHGHVAPNRCTRGTSLVGSHCYLTCSKGYKVIGNPVRTCSKSGSWTPEGVSPFCEKDSIVPFIQCPSDLIVDLAPHQKTSYVTLPKPKSNVDWFRVTSSASEVGAGKVDREEAGRFVDASPEWAKDLEEDLPSGRTTITFIARSPLSDTTASCSFVVFVRDTESPQVYGCPKSFHVQLGPTESATEVTWVEPVFKDNVEVSHIYKSMESGKELSAGTYPVHYVAVDPQRNRAKCSFVITVEAAPPVQRLYQSNQIWVVCPGLNGEKPIQMYAWRVPQDCIETNPSTNADHVHWDPTLTPSEVHTANSAEEEEPHPKTALTQEASAYGDLTVSQAFSTNGKPPPGEWASSSALAFANKNTQDKSTAGKDQDYNRQNKLNSFYKNSFSHLFQGNPQTFALAHARAGTMPDGSQGSSSFAHAQTNDENIQALAHARATVFNYG